VLFPAPEGPSMAMVNLFLFDALTIPPPKKVGKGDPFRKPRTSILEIIEKDVNPNLGKGQKPYLF
jgi:hypothetical protein